MVERDYWDLIRIIIFLLLLLIATYTLMMVTIGFQRVCQVVVVEVHLLVLSNGRIIISKQGFLRDLYVSDNSEQTGQMLRTSITTIGISK